MTSSFKTKRLVESALMIALSTILSFIILFRLPFGGSITACCMLPVILVSYRYGVKWGFATAFAFSLIQGIQGIAEGTFSAAALGVENGVFNGGFFSGSRCWQRLASSCWITSLRLRCWVSAASSVTKSKTAAGSGVRHPAGRSAAVCCPRYFGRYLLWYLGRVVLYPGRLLRMGTDFGGYVPGQNPVCVVFADL